MLSHKKSGKWAKPKIWGVAVSAVAARRLSNFPIGVVKKKQNHHHGNICCMFNAWNSQAKSLPTPGAIYECQERNSKRDLTISWTWLFLFGIELGFRLKHVVSFLCCPTQDMSCSQLCKGAFRRMLYFTLPGIALARSFRKPFQNLHQYAARNYD